MVTSDRLYIDPKEYFHPEDNRVPPHHGGYVKKYGPYILAVTGSSLGILAQHYYLKKPWYAGPLKHLVLGAGSCWLVEQWRVYHYEKSKRQAYFIYNYIKDNPELFPLIERQKFEDVFDSWRPTR